MDLLKLLIVALAPAFAVMVYIYSRDKYEKEPLKVLIISFFLGAVSVIPAIILESVGQDIIYFGKGHVQQTFIKAFILVGLSEEFSKYIFLRYYAFRNRAFNEPFDGIVYAVMISMGFAAVENVMYVLNGGIQVGYLRAITSIPAHAVFAVFMGYYAGKAKFSTKKRSTYLIFGLFAATLMHGFYDFFLMLENFPALYILSFVGLAVAILISLRAIKKAQKDSPFRFFQRRRE